MQITWTNPCLGVAEDTQTERKKWVKSKKEKPRKILNIINDE